MFTNKEIEILKTARQIAIMSIIQNMIVTGLWIALAVIFNKWWVGLFSLITFKSVTYKKDDKEEK